MKKILLVLAFLGSLQMQAQISVTKDDLLELKNRLEGNFDSQEQSQTDKSYYNISLHMKEMFFNQKSKPNLKTKTKTKTPKQAEGYYLYVEQALMASPDKPYRQRIYFLSRKGDSVLTSQIYEMKEPLRFAGAWNDLSKLKNLTIDSLTEKPGCTMYLYKNEDGNYIGGTRENNCESNLKGASFATSEVTIYPNMLISWDRGWDTNHKQMWGAEKGGYRFRKFIPLRRKD